MCSDQACRGCLRDWSRHSPIEERAAAVRGSVSSTSQRREPAVSIIRGAIGSHAPPRHARGYPRETGLRGDECRFPTPTNAEKPSGRGFDRHTGRRRDALIRKPRDGPLIGDRAPELPLLPGGPFCRAEPTRSATPSPARPALQCPELRLKRDRKR